MNQPQMAPQAAPQMEPPKKGVGAWLWIVLVIVVLGAAGYFGWYYFGNKITGDDTPTPTTNTNTTTDPTAIWKTYINTKYGYSIKIPQNYGQMPTENSAFTTTVSPTADNITLGENKPNSKELIIVNILQESDASKLLSEGSPTVSVINIGSSKNIEAKKITSEAGAAIMSSILVKHNDIYVKLYEQNNQTIFNQMLSTFKFTTASTGTDVSTADWKTYTSEAYGFSFKYPSTWIKAENSGEGLVQLYSTNAEGRELKSDETRIVVKYSENADNQTVAEFLESEINKNASGSKIQSKKSITVDSKKAEKYITIPPELGTKMTYIAIQLTDGNFIKILCYENNDQFDQILSTFQFTQ